jgi:hypothetical protein
LLSGRHPPWVTYHNIVGVVGYNESPEEVAEGSDGVVAFASAHLDNVASEVIVDADHVNVHRHPLAVLEVRRILLEHLASQRRWQGPQTPEFRVTGHEARPSAEFGVRSAEWITPLPAGPATPQVPSNWATAP